ncbi:hypothetical protein AGMMS50256_25870 [Betaproteobacteria bacterium]|nr:hypothetical protein AGMMS50256_25870 [Betaproteobacteria bacterium]
MPNCRPVTPADLAVLRPLPQFPDTAEELIRVAGIEAAAQLISAWPKQQYPVPMRVGGGTPLGARRYAQLEEVVGGPAAARIVRYYKGTILYIPSCEAALWAREKDGIRARADELFKEGYSLPQAVFALGLAYDRSGREIERLLSEPDTLEIPVPPRGKRPTPPEMSEDHIRFLLTRPVQGDLF